MPIPDKLISKSSRLKTTNMIAHISNNNTRRSVCTAPTVRRVRRSPHTACAQVQLLLQKQQKRVRVPLAIKSTANDAVPEAVAPVAPYTLPLTLPRPIVGEVSASSFEEAYPELVGVAAEYIRDKLPSTGVHMLAALANVKASPPKASLPKELEIIMNDAIAAACPTHMLAVYSATASPSQKRKVTLFPSHHLVLAAHCTKLPTLPTSRPTTSGATTTLPVVSLCLPSAEAFPLLQSYLYTKSASSLLASLLPSDAPLDTTSLTHRARMIHGLWRDSCALGVVDSQLFDIIDQAWGSVVGALQTARS